MIATRLVLGPAVEAAAAERTHKGSSLLAELTDYTVLDLETTGLDPRWDEIIEVGALRVRGGEVSEHFTSLVKPLNEIDEFITELTGITNEMVADAPPIGEVLPQLRAFIGQDVVIGHNVNFDVNFLYDISLHLKLEPFSNDFVDTMRLSRRLYPEERHHRLVDLSKRHCSGLQVDHRALGDAQLTKACYDAMLGVMAERGVTMQDLKPKTGYNPADGVKATVDTFDTTTAVYGKTFVFTGALDGMVRKDAMQLVVDLGGLVDDAVTKNTNFLVLGSSGYSSALKDGKSSKHKKVEKMQAKGLDVQIITEDVFYEMIREAAGEGANHTEDK